MPRHPLARTLLPLLAVLATAPRAVSAQARHGSPPVLPAETPSAPPLRFRSLTDSLAWARARGAAESAPGRRLIVSLRERRLWWKDGARTLYAARVAVGKGTRLEYGDSVWRFDTPLGVRRVLRKEANPVWVPPLWHYAELARDSAYTLIPLKRTGATPLADGTRLEVRGDRVVRVLRGGRVEEIPADEEILYGDSLFVPPTGTANRRIVGELGAYKLELGGGYLLHGTPYKDSIGRAVTHGCIRLGDADLLYLYRSVPVGTPVYIY